MCAPAGKKKKKKKHLSVNHPGGLMLGGRQVRSGAAAPLAGFSPAFRGENGDCRAGKMIAHSAR